MKIFVDKENIKKPIENLIYDFIIVIILLYIKIIMQNMKENILSSQLFVGKFINVGKTKLKNEYS